MTDLTDDQVITDTRRWVERAVIGLNLCPFAGAVHARGRIRLRVSPASDEAALLEDLQRELLYLCDADPAQWETTLLVHPRVLGDFLDYNDFLGLADALLEDLGLDGIMQIASFHPRYQFAGTAVDDVTNNTNRSPYPMLHILREASVEKAVDTFPDTAEISERNQRTLLELGPQGWRRVVDGEPGS